MCHVLPLQANAPTLTTENEYKFVYVVSYIESVSVLLTGYPHADLVPVAGALIGGFTAYHSPSQTAGHNSRSMIFITPPVVRVRKYCAREEPMTSSCKKSLSYSLSDPCTPSLNLSSMTLAKFDDTV